jgi:hypothetical protein
MYVKNGYESVHWIHLVQDGDSGEFLRKRKLTFGFHGPGEHIYDSVSPCDELCSSHVGTELVDNDRYWVSFSKYNEAAYCSLD